MCMSFFVATRDRVRHWDLPFAEGRYGTRAYQSQQVRRCGRVAFNDNVRLGHTGKSLGCDT